MNKIITFLLIFFFCKTYQMNFKNPATATILPFPKSNHDKPYPSIPEKQAIYPQNNSISHYNHYMEHFENFLPTNKNRRCKK